MFNLWNISRVCWEELRENWYPKKEHPWNCFQEGLLSRMPSLWNRNQQIQTWEPSELLKNAERGSCKIQDQKKKNPTPLIQYSRNNEKVESGSHRKKSQTKLSTCFAPGTSRPVINHNCEINHLKCFLWSSKTRSILHNCSKPKAAQVSCSEKPFNARKKEQLLLNTTSAAAQKGTQRSAGLYLTSPDLSH